MNKTEKLVLLINLLHHRKYTTFETIRKICGISARTVYRYINSISRANIPVQYDKTLRAYRVDSRDSFGIEDLKASDAVLLLVALHVLSQKLDNAYVEDVERLEKRILSKLTFPLEEVWESFGTRSEEAFQSENLSDLVTSLLVHTSVINNKKLALVLADADQRSRAIEIANPSLTFKQEWRLEDSLSGDKKAIPVSRIRKATIV